MEVERGALSRAGALHEEKANQAGAKRGRPASVDTLEACTAFNGKPPVGTVYTD